MNEKLEKLLDLEVGWDRTCNDEGEGPTHVVVLSFAMGGNQVQIDLTMIPEDAEDMHRLLGEQLAEIRLDKERRKEVVEYERDDS